MDVLKIDSEESYVKAIMLNVTILLRYGRQFVQPYVKQTETVNGSFVRP
jgi:hypothetical protein